MSRLHWKVLLLAILVTYLGNHGVSQGRAEAHFEEKLSQAKRLLSTLPTGWNFAMGLESYGTYIDAIKIYAHSPSFLMKHNHADGGGIRRGEDGSYEILLNPSVSVERMAHTLAHELQHIRDEIVADNILSQNPQLKSRIDETTQWIHAGDTRKAMNERPTETTYVIKVLFCTEYRAHTLNLMLLREGLNDFFLEDSDQVLKHVNSGYIHRHGFRLTKEDQALLTQQCAYKRLMEREASPMQTVLESILPKEQLRRKEDRS